MSPEAFSRQYSKSFSLLERNDLYYSSYVYIKKAILNRENPSPKKVEKVIDLIHPTLFIYDSELDKLRNFKSALDFPVGVRAFFRNDYDTALKRLSGVDKKHSLYIESSYLLGILSLIKKEPKKAGYHFNECAKSSYKKDKNILKSEAYIYTFRNRCKQAMARVLYSEKKFELAMKILNTVRKTDYLWPRLLLDKAWTYYHMNENARALGTVISYNSPALKRFTTPEARYLQALMYFEMCYYEKTESISSDFNQHVWANRNIFRKNSDKKLLKLILAKKVPKNPKDQILYYYLKGFKKDTRYMNYMKSTRLLRREIRKLEKLKKQKKLSIAQVLLNHNNTYRRIMLKDFVDFLQTVVEDNYNQITKMKRAFTKIELMLSIVKRQRLKSNKPLNISEKKKRLPLSEIPNTSDKFIWDFQGGYWADELGDYAVALKNRCSK